MAAGISVTWARNRSRRPNAFDRCRSAASTECTDLTFQHGPGLGAVFVLPLGIEAGAAQRAAEYLRVGAVESHPLPGERALQGCIQRGHILALELGRRVEVAFDDVLQNLRQRCPDPA